MTHDIAAGAVIDLANDLLKANLLSPDVLYKHSAQLHTLATTEVTQKTLEKRLPERDFLWLWSLLSNHPNGLKLAWLIGQKTDLSSTGILANWISNCSTLNEALETFCNNISLLNPSERWTIKRSLRVTKIFLSFSNNLYRDIAEARSLSAAFCWSKMLSRNNIHPESVTMRIATPSSEIQRILEDDIGGDIHYGAAQTSIALRNKDLRAEIPGNSPYIYELLAEKASSLHKEFQGRAPFTTLVIDLLNKDLNKHSRLEQILTELNISRSNLARKLREENTSYSKLLDEQRQKRFFSLDAKLSNTLISEALGFNNESAFYRAKRRWTSN